MSNRTVPADAEAMSKLRRDRLDDAIHQAFMFAKLQNHLVNEMLGGALQDNDTMRVSEEDRNLLVFVAGEASAAVDRLELCAQGARFDQ